MPSNRDECASAARCHGRRSDPQRRASQVAESCMRLGASSKWARAHCSSLVGALRRMQSFTSRPEWHKSNTGWLLLLPTPRAMQPCMSARVCVCVCARAIELASHDGLCRPGKADR